MRSRKLVGGLAVVLGVLAAGTYSLRSSAEGAVGEPAGGSGFASSLSPARRGEPLPHSSLGTHQQAAVASGAGVSVQGAPEVQGGMVAAQGSELAAAAPPVETLAPLERMRRFFTDALTSSEQRKVELERACGGEGCVQCATDADCPGGVGCGLQLLDDKFQAVCLPSNCKADADCSSGLACRNVSATASAVQVFRCTKPGSLREGDTCFPFSGDPATSCGPGLVCPLLTCARACESDGQCRGGERCMRGGCTLACQSDADCGAGNACVRLNDGTMCRAVKGHQPNCREAGNECNPGETCLAAGDGKSVVFSCNQCCGDGQACGAGFVCGPAGVYSGQCPMACYKACASDSDCLETEVCSLADTVGGQRACTPAPRNYVKGGPTGDGGVSTSL